MIKKKYLLLLKNNLEDFQDFIEEIQQKNIFQAEVVYFENLDQVKENFEKNNYQQIALALSKDFYSFRKEAIESFIGAWNKSFLQNMILLITRPENFSFEENENKDKNFFLLYKNEEPEVSALQFLLFTQNVFKKNLTEKRLSRYIVDATQGLVNAEILKRQKKQIEELNYELDKKNTKMNKDLDMAQKVQLAIIPSQEKMPKRKEIRVSCEYMPMEKIGGDFYDVLEIDKNTYAFLIADVCGHGVASALITTMLKVSFESFARQKIEPAMVCHSVNQEILKSIGESGYYFSAYYAVLSLENGRFDYCNAGHQPALFYQAKTQTVQKLNTKGGLIGLFENNRYETKTVFLEPGDRIVFFTDGIIDTRNPQKQFYGQERLSHFLISRIHLEAQEWIQALKQDLEYFAAGCPPSDDRSLLVLDFISVAE